MTSGTSHVDIAVDGMTCASCAHRIERRLNKLEGVSATVNYATEQATVDFDEQRVAPSDILGEIARIGYRPRLSDTAESAVSDLRVRVLVSTTLTIPVMAVSMIPMLQFTHWQWLAMVLATPVVMWAGFPLHRSTWTNARHGSVTMDTLISVGTLSAWIWSMIALLVLDAGSETMPMHFSVMLDRSASSEAVYFEVAAAVVTFVLAGRYFEHRSKRDAGRAIRALLEVGAQEATVVDESGEELQVPVGELKVGQRFVVRPGEKIATDGVVVEGESSIDRSLLTGESLPERVTAGDAVAGATINVNGRLVVEATRVGADTALAQIARLVTQAQSGKAPVQRLADRVASVFVPVVMGLAALTLAGWLLTGASVTIACAAAVAVLIVACPCALGLATPMALLVGTGRGAQIGLVIKGPEILESTQQIDTIVLDKTGTVTTGAMALSATITSAGVSHEEALLVAGSLEHASEHPIARAIAEAARELGTLQPVSDFQNVPGMGVRGVIAGQDVVAGRPELLAADGIALPRELDEALTQAQNDGSTAVCIARNGAALAVLVISDTIKPTSREAVTLLRQLGLRPILLTGDNAATAESVGRQIGIDTVIANVLPADKASVITDLQKEGHIVAMAGDGINDAPALAQADLGLAIGTGTDVAIEASDLTLVSGDLRAAADAIRLSRRTLATIKGNLFWAFAYNVCALPLAALGYLNPMIAGAAMAFSSAFVVSNSLRLRRFTPQR